MTTTHDLLSDRLPGTPGRKPRAPAAADCGNVATQSDALVCSETAVACQVNQEMYPSSMTTDEPRGPVVRRRREISQLAFAPRPIARLDVGRVATGHQPATADSRLERFVGERPDSSASDLGVLLARAAEGDADSWCQITTRFTRLLWAVARSYRLSSEDCADVVQTTWLRLVEHLRTIENPNALPGWLATTARREALSQLRRRTHDAPLEADSPSSRTDNGPREADAPLLDEERDAQLWRCFDQLPERDQRMLRILMSWDRPSYTSVAAALDLPVGSIGPTRMRALERLRGIITSSGYPFQTTA
jgi:RNA polymerase sigma factor (sigma-70 family)